MTQTTITISGEGQELIDRLKAGVKSNELIDLFGMKLACVNLDIHSDPANGPAGYCAVMIAQEVVMAQPVQAADHKDRVAGWATDIDWSKAQDSDTHYDPLSRVFVNFDAMHDWDRKLIPRPSPWSGDDLPPVGVEMEFSFKGHDQGTGIVLCYGQEMCFIRNTSKGLEREQCGDIEDYDFRPTKTPEQIAAEEREAAIEAMLEILPAGIRGERKATCAALYDAGLRFPKGDDQ